MGPCVEVWGQLWGYLGRFWGPVWRLWGLGGSYGVIWGAVMGPCVEVMGLLGGSYGALWGVVMGPCGAVWGQLWGSVGRFGGFVVSAKLAMKANRHLLQESVPSAPQINPC